MADPGLGDEMAKLPFGTGSAAETANQPAGLAQVAGGLYSSLGELAKRLFGASEQMRGGGTYNAAPGVEAALTSMGGPLVGASKGAGEAVLGAGPIVRVERPIPAFHSSRHDFTDFQDVGKIGEGNRAFGEGGYFAENPAVSGQGGYYWDKFRQDMPFRESQLARRFKNVDFDRDALLRQTEQQLNDMINAKPHYDVQNKMDVYDKMFAKYNETLEKLRTPGSQIGPRTYEVNIHANPDDMLQWHKTLDQQPQLLDRLGPDVRAAIDDLADQRGYNGPLEAPEAYTGEQLYKMLKHYDVHEALPAELPGSSWYTGHTNEAKHTAAYLESLGVPGIKYLDEFSRPSRIAPGVTPTNNYVVFPGQLPNVEVMKKYGVPATAGLGTSLGASMLSRMPTNEQRT